MVAEKRRDVYYISKNLYLMAESFRFAQHCEGNTLSTAICLTTPPPFHFLFIMAVLSLPLYFSNSFWSQDYRKGLEVLYTKLEQVRGTAHVSKRHTPHITDVSQGVLENSELIAFIRVSVRILHGAMPSQPITSTGPSTGGGEY